MNELQAKCEEILTGSDVDDDRKNGFCNFLRKMGRRATYARWIYPLTYFALGALAWVGIEAFGEIQTDAWRRYFAAVVVFTSAVIAFWRPNVNITQLDCNQYLGKKLAGTDLSDLNALLSLRENQHDKMLKLIGAAGSLFSIYLTLE